MIKNPIIKALAGYFVRGLLFVAPVGITIYILMSVFNTIDSILQFKIPVSANQEMLIPGLGFIIVILITAAVGFVFSVIFPSSLQGIIETAINKLPVVRMVYFSLKDLVSAFVGDKKKFDAPVLVVVDKVNNFKKIGFITQDDLSAFDLKEDLMIYFPQSYAFAGDLFIVPKDTVTKLNMNAADALKMIVSGGISKDAKA